MIIYQVLCTIPNDVAQEWREWMMQEHIADVMNTEMFIRYSMSLVLKPEQEDGVRYCIQYVANSLDEYERYRTEFAPVLQLAVRAKFGDSIEIERMVMAIDAQS